MTTAVAANPATRSGVPVGLLPLNFRLKGTGNPEPIQFFTQSGMEGMNTFLTDFEMRKYRLMPKADAVHMELCEIAPEAEAKVIVSISCRRNFLTAQGSERTAKYAGAQKRVHLNIPLVNRDFSDARTYGIRVGISTTTKCTEAYVEKREMEIAILASYRCGLLAAHEAMHIAQVNDCQEVSDFIDDWRNS
jgi:hypothetical protein